MPVRAPRRGARQGASMAGEEPRLYSDLAAWWPLFSPPERYAGPAAFYSQLLVGACAPRTLLELGSGGGCNASHLKAHFELVLVDRSPAMLAVSRSLNPECEHVQGDMRTVRLGRLFDAVFVHDAVMYLTDEDDLGRAIETAAVHCRPGGAVLLAPDCFRETFVAGTGSGGSDDGARGLRYLEWTRDPDPSDSTFTTDFAYLLRSGDGPLHVVHETHTLGLFGRATWLGLCEAAGLEPRIHTETYEGRSYERILCRRRT